MTRQRASLPLLVITGPVGSVKPTVADALSELLVNKGFPHAAIDMDRLRVTRPTPVDDPFGERAGRRHLAAFWPLLLQDWVRCVILADVVEDRAGYLRELATVAPGCRPTIVRLEVPMPEILRRLQSREGQNTLDWYRSRAPELQRIMDRGQVQDVLIEAGERSPAAIAGEIAELTGLHGSEVRRSAVQLGQGLRSLVQGGFGALVGAVDVLLEFGALHPPLVAPADLDALQVAAADQGVGLRGRDVEDVGHIRQGEKPFVRHGVRLPPRGTIG